MKSFNWEILVIHLICLIIYYMKPLQQIKKYKEITKFPILLKILESVKFIPICQ